MNLELKYNILLKKWTLSTNNIVIKVLKDAIEGRKILQGGKVNTISE